MDTAEFEHAGGEYFPVKANRKKVERIKFEREEEGINMQAILLQVGQDQWLSLDNPYLWDIF